MRISLTRITAAIAIACCTAAAPAAAQTPNVNGLIAYTDCSGMLCDIWIMNADGSGKTNLTQTPDANEMDPSWSPDGTRIAYVEGTDYAYRIMVMNADGSAQAAVTPDVAYHFGPTWSADGTRIAFVREVPGIVIAFQFDIFAVNVDGSGEVNLTNSDFGELDPAWAPDGSRIAFAGVRFETTVNPITGEPEEAAQWEIVTINPDGSGEQVLTTGEPGSERQTRLEEDRSPAWSPDSRFLVFQTQSVDPCCPPWAIAEVNREGTAIVPLSDNPAVNDVAPEYSPDGTLIVFTSDRDAVVGGDFDVYTMPVPPRGPALLAAAPVEAAAAQRLTFNGRASDPSWGRDAGITLPVSFALGVRIWRLGGSGFVASAPAGIVCGRDCTETFTEGTRVAMRAVPNASSLFLGWSGACTGRSQFCVVTMDQVKSVGAVFVRKP
jgi:Tol biopolymer transport system component